MSKSEKEKIMSENKEETISKKQKIALVVIIVILCFICGVYVFSDGFSKYGDARDNMTESEVEFHEKNNEFYKNL